MMKRSSLFATVLALALFVGTAAQAGVFFEPYAGYHFGTSAGEGLFVGSDGDTYDGPGFGARLGALLGKSFFIAGDFQYGLLKDEDDNKFKQLTVGADLGVKVDAFRIWGGVNFISQATFDEQFAGQDVSVKGLGYKAGVGYVGALRRSLA